MSVEEESMLLGKSLLGAQKIEYVLYGIASHLSHLPEAQKDKRLRNLNPEKFLRGGVEDLKVTLGQLELAFGEKLLLDTVKLKAFIDVRNTIIHNYWRLTRTKTNLAENIPDPIKFLNDFITQADYWNKVMNGMLCVFREQAAKKENRTHEISFTAKEKEDMQAFYHQAKK